MWLMMIPMMMKVDFLAVRRVGERPMGLVVTLFVNWLVKPFSIAFACMSVLPLSLCCLDHPPFDVE